MSAAVAVQLASVNDSIVRLVELAGVMTCVSETFRVVTGSYPVTVCERSLTCQEYRHVCALSFQIETSLSIVIETLDEEILLS